MSGFIIFDLWRTVLLTDRSGLGGVNRPVGDQGKTRPGITDFDLPVHETLNKVMMLASQAINLDLGKFCGFEIVQGARRTRARTLHHMEISHGGRDSGMAEEVLDRSDISSRFQEMGGPASLRYAGEISDKEWRHS